MQTNRLRIGLRRLALTSLLTLVFASGWAQAEKRVALVIGNGDYVHAPKLANPVNDANAFSDRLEALGFEVVKRLDLNFIDFLKVIKEFGLKSEQADWSLIYYAGHAVQIQGENYLVPVDVNVASPVDLEATVRADLLIREAEDSLRFGLVILDACRDNPFVEKLNNGGRSVRSNRGLAREGSIKSDVLVAYATEKGNIAEDGDDGNSPYMKALLKNLETPGLEVEYFFRKVRDDVMKATENRQMPFKTGSLGATQYYLTPPAAPQDSPAAPASGIARGHARRYLIDAQGVITDRETGIQWMPCALGQHWTGEDCAGEATEMKWDDAVQRKAEFAGKDDWRLPSIDELRSLVFCSNGKPAFYSNGENGDAYGCWGDPGSEHAAPAIESAVFPSAPDAEFWSASGDAEDPKKAWHVDFYHGGAKLEYKYYYLKARLMRNGQMTAAAD